MAAFLSFVIGAIFGIGLIVSGMSNPAKVLGFLDLAGPWDPSLALVMAAALLPAAAAYLLMRRREISVLGKPLQIPALKRIDHRLVIGSALFGIGWGLAGICPGPAFVLAGSGTLQGLAFVAALLVGMGVFEFQQRIRRLFFNPNIGN